VEEMTILALENEFKSTPHAVGSGEVRWLYAHLPPLPIRHAKDHSVYKRVVEHLMGAGKTQGEFRPYLDAVIHFVDEYESDRFPARSTPEDVLRILMEQQNLTQKDLAEEMGGQSVVSAVLTGKRKLTRDHIENLSRRFSVHVGSFFSVSKNS
jgi:HTH-type transcriptional regulator/antitoxin HigA